MRRRAYSSAREHAFAQVCGKMLFSISAAICAFFRRSYSASPDEQAKLIAEKLKLKTLSKEWKAEGKWLRFGVVKFADVDGKEHTYETVERTTRNGHLDGVDVLAYLESNKLDGKHVILVLSYRPPIGRICMEFPAGLIDKGESPEKAALRELKEETGFSGRLVGEVSPELFGDPWKSTENTALVTVYVDGNEPENDENLTEMGKFKNLEGEEFLDVLIVPLNDLHAKILQYSKELGFGVDSKLYSFALALHVSMK